MSRARPPLHDAMSWGMCAEQQKLAGVGFIALAEGDPAVQWLAGVGAIHGPLFHRPRCGAAGSVTPCLAYY